jgi:peptidoglycan hydrolase-like protein with peptidoglycan-binding domain
MLSLPSSPSQPSQPQEPIMSPTTAFVSSFNAAAVSPTVLKEALLAEPVALGATGDAVRRVQEWLTLGRIGVKIDGSFGPATETAVRMLQAQKSLPVNGVVDEDTYSVLLSPIAAALAPTPSSGSLGADIIAVGEQHVAQHPREIGGENSGPWVRMYMNGDEGVDFPWCAGFACFVMKQAAAGRPLPFTPGISCDGIAQSARERGLLRDGGTIKPEDITPGSFFLVRRATAPGWHHTGLVVAANGSTVTTLEGNTNDDGSREGYEAIRRVRTLAAVDYIILPS